MAMLFSQGLECGDELVVDAEFFVTDRNRTAGGSSVSIRSRHGGLRSALVDWGTTAQYLKRAPGAPRSGCSIDDIVRSCPLQIWECVPEFDAGGTGRRRRKRNPFDDFERV
jgi:hypothetical protein